VKPVAGFAGLRAGVEQDVGSKRAGYDFIETVSQPREAVQLAGLG